MIPESNSANTISIIAIIVSVLVTMIGFLRAILFNRPRLTIDITNTKGNSRPTGYSPKTPIKEIKDENGVVHTVYDGNNAISFFRCEWIIEVVITNNSPNTAYFTEMFFRKDDSRFSTIDKLNKNTPIASGEKKLLKAKYIMEEECHGNDRTSTGKFPSDLDDLEIYLRYNNKFRVKFATHYHYQKGEQTNYFVKFKSSRFDFQYK